MSGLQETLSALRVNRRTPEEQIARGALGQRAHWTSLFNLDMANKLRIDAEEQLAAAKERQPDMGAVELMKDDDVRIGDEYHINYSEPAKPQPTDPPASSQAKSSTLGTLGSMAAGAAILASGAGLAQVPALLNSADHPPAATAPTDPAIDTDTITDVEIRGGIEEAK